MTFLERLQTEILIGDGASGTMLYARGVGLDANFEHLNLVKPALVGELHREYLAAGARLLETNTFGANLTKLAPIGLEQKLREINRQGALLARQAVTDAGLPADSVYVAGSVGPLARLRGEERELSSADMTAIYREQVVALAEGGVDLFVLETFADLDQLLCALAAVQETGRPAIASMAYLEGARTAAGVAAATAARALAAAGAAVIGANCGAGPLEVLHTLQQLATATSLPLAAFANSGFPEYVDGRHIYRTTPDYFAERGAEMVAAGAVVVGGCCGTTPAHIRALAQRLQGLRPAARTIAVAVAAPVELPTASQAAGGFLANWGKRPVVTVELDPPKGLDCRKVLAGARALKEAGADAINLAENPLARVRMGNIALARLIQDEVGIEVIVHVTCRDRNLLGLQSDLMGASLLGIRSILAVTGDPARLGDQAGASSVFDLNSFGLIKLLADLNAGINALGHPIGGSTGFTIGGALNPNSPKPELQVARLAKKVAAGARFAQTQPIYGVEPLRTVLALAAPLGIPVLPGIMPLVSERNCEYLHNEVPGITVPDEIRARMRGKEKEAGVREGLAIARELVTALKLEVGGFYLIAPFGRHEIVAELVREIKG